MASGATKQSKCGNAGGVARTHIGEQDAAPLHHRIGLLLDVAAEVELSGSAGVSQAVARHVEQPAVERAAQAAVLEPAVGEVGAAVRAGALEQAVAALVVAEQHQVLAEQPHRLDRPRGRASSSTSAAGCQ